MESKSAEWRRLSVFQILHVVKYLLEHDRRSVDDLFNRNFDVQVLEERVLKSL